ncbi:hypothetical protein HDU96_009142 [Phlyctochytrium bullatum]|nr:hypothetical protein HDU96_009142 [Phlyctochytrium bullatum]
MTPPPPSSPPSMEEAASSSSLHTTVADDTTAQAAAAAAAVQSSGDFLVAEKTGNLEKKTQDDDQMEAITTERNLEEAAAVEDKNSNEGGGLNLFQKYLTLWVLIAMAIGIVLGRFVPAIPSALEKATLAQVSVPIAVLLWGIILPMMIQIDFRSIVNAIKQPKPILLTVILNYAVQPFTMYGLALLFFRVVFGSSLDVAKQDAYLIGTILLGGAPCTAMVFVWSSLMKGDASYTLTQVAVNDILLLILYTPTAKLLSRSSSLEMPWNTLIASVAFFIVIPLVIGIIIRVCLTRTPAGTRFLNTRLLPFLDSCSMVFLLLMVVLLFVSQAATVVSHLVDILIIAVPLIIQTLLLWALAYFGALWLRLPYDQAGPASLIACSNFFEMAVAIAVALYGSESPAALATVVGVLIEVPIMLALVWVNNRTQHWFPKKEVLEAEKNTK